MGLSLIDSFCRLYYQYDVKYLAFCTNPIHALLHIADNIRWLGPPSQYWCFSIERFGAWVKTQAINNRKKPIQFLNNRLRREEQVGRDAKFIIVDETKADRDPFRIDSPIDRNAGASGRGDQVEKSRQFPRR
jgi:hypothetical protein